MASDAKERQSPEIFFMFIIDQRAGKQGIAKLLSQLSGKERYLVSKSANI